MSEAMQPLLDREALAKVLGLSPKTVKLKVLDLFSGIGGFSLGLERTDGFETVAFCEIDPFCRRVLAKHWPDVPIIPDVSAEEFPAADVITAGFPCQDISDAGLRAGITGARSWLWRHVVRAVCLVRPKFAILENVAALLHRGMGVVLRDLAAAGYDAEWDCVPASRIGAPHKRDRVWIVAYPAQIRRGQVQFDEFGAQAQAAGFFAGVGAEEVREWPSDAVVCRASDGVPDRPHAVGALGNAVVPQIPELIGRAILEARHD